jgi:hypothetical protein
VTQKFKKFYINEKYRVGEANKNTQSRTSSCSNCLSDANKSLLMPDPHSFPEQRQFDRLVLLPVIATGHHVIEQSFGVDSRMARHHLSPKR